MKNLRTGIYFAIVAIFYFTSSVNAQNALYREPDYNKPKFFDAYPVEINISTDMLDELLSSRPNQTISRALSADNNTLPFQGKVMSEVNREDGNFRRIMIKSTNYPDATLTIWKYLDDQGILRYQARIISFTHGDAYVLEKRATGYALIKKGFYDIINE
ncbi:MAG: hypothetical protein V9F46_08430 [Chitinophagaceae bacterium]|jgi:hypothetical protein